MIASEQKVNAFALLCEGEKQDKYCIMFVNKLLITKKNK